MRRGRRAARDRARRRARGRSRAGCSAPSSSPPASTTSSTRASTKRSCRPRWPTRTQLVVQVSGVAEIAGGLAVLLPSHAPARRASWLIALLAAVFPANLYMARDAGALRAHPALGALRAAAAAAADDALGLEGDAPLTSGLPGRGASRRCYVRLAGERIAPHMATATAVKITPAEQEALTLGRAARLARSAARPRLPRQAPGRGARAGPRPADDLLRGPAPPRGGEPRAHAHVRPRRAGPALAQRADAARRPARARRAARALLLQPRRPRRLRVPHRRRPRAPAGSARAPIAPSSARAVLLALLRGRARRCWRTCGSGSLPATASRAPAATPRNRPPQGGFSCPRRVG